LLATILIDKLLPESFQSAVNISTAGMAHPDFFQGGRLPALPPTCRRPWLRPNDCMDQDVTWYGAKPQPRQLCVRWRPNCPVPHKGRSTPPKKKLGPCSLWPNGWMAEAGPCHGGRPQTRRLCVRWGPSPLPQKGAEPPPQFSVHFYCGRIKIRLGTDVGLCPGDFAI